MRSDEYMLQMQVRSLERENRTLRRNLRDEFAMAALTGLLARPGRKGPASDFAQDAFLLANAALEARL